MIHFKIWTIWLFLFVTVNHSLAIEFKWLRWLGCLWSSQSLYPYNSPWKYMGCIYSVSFSSLNHANNLLLAKPFLRVTKQLAPHGGWFLKRLNELPIKGLGISCFQ